MPRTLGLGNVMLNSFTSHISNAPKEFSGAPEMSLSKISSQPFMLFKDSVGRISFKELQSFRNTHNMRNFNKKMYMVWLHAKLINFKSIFTGGFLDGSFAKPFDFAKLERVPCILAFPHKVKCILSDTVPKMCKFHFFISCTKFKNTAHAKIISGACADSGAHFLYYLKNLRRFSLPCAEAQGILCM